MTAESGKYRSYTGTEQPPDEVYWDWYQLCHTLAYTANESYKEAESAMEKALRSGVTMEKIGEKASAVFKRQAGLTEYPTLMDDMTERKNSSVFLRRAWQAAKKRSVVSSSAWVELL